MEGNEMGKSKYYNPKQTPLEAYRKRKLRILERDFRIKITAEELKHAETLTSEIQIDQFCLGMINKYWR
jgi:hypothetical protein